MEIWKPIIGYNGMYEASNLGRIKSNYSDGLILSPAIDNRGYHRCNLWKDDKGTTKKVHRVIAKTFIPNPENKPQVNHKNCIKTDNRVENIEWCTISENVIHAIENGLIKIPDNTGENHGMAKLTEEKVLLIRDINPPTYNEKCELADILGVSFSTIYDILKRKSWSHI